MRRAVARAMEWFCAGLALALALAAMLSCISCTTAQLHAVGEFLGLCAPAATAAGQPWLTVVLGAIGHWLVEQPAESVPTVVGATTLVAHATHGIPGTRRGRRKAAERAAARAVNAALDAQDAERAAAKKKTRAALTKAQVDLHVSRAAPKGPT